jgi:hypothetical protein
LVARWSALPGRTRAAIAGGTIIGAVVLVWLIAGGSSRPPTADGTPSPDASAVGERLQVAPLNGCAYLTDAEIEEAMGLLDIPWVERILIQYGGGEACTWIHSRDGVDVEGLSVQIGPGTVDDFEPDAQLGGVTGEPVAGIGRLAVWFGTDRAGTLSVVAESRLGYLFVRITVARPDLDAGEILPVAVGLAAAALPRFPGMAGALEPEVVTFEHEPPDMSAGGYVDNLLAREADGEWTREEGLVETLRLFLGEARPGDVLRHAELADESGSGIIAMARGYLEQGSDESAQEEIARLLERLVFTREQLDAVTGTRRPDVVLAVHHQPPGPRGGSSEGDLCEDNGAPSPCLIQYSSPELSELEALYGPNQFVIYLWSNYEDVGWTTAHLQWIGEAFSASVKTYKTLGQGQMPPTDLVVTPFGGPTVIAHGDAQSCALNINPAMQALPDGQFKQTIAGHLALCYIGATFPATAHRESARWWRDGLAVYLSNVVYPAPACGGSRCDLEWRDLPGLLAAAELRNTILDRSNSNAFFFQQLSWSEGNQGILNLIGQLQVAAAEQEATLAGYRGMPERFHEYIENLTDATVPDTGGGLMPYLPPDETTALSNNLLLLDEPRPFGTTRWHLLVDTGEKACLTTTLDGDVQLSWRLGEPGSEGIASDWVAEPPGELEENAVMVFTTTTRGSEVSVEVKVVDHDEECDPPPTPEGSGCLPIICEPSDYFRSLTNLPDWFSEVLE